jgi:hypothetical protein
MAVTRTSRIMVVPRNLCVEYAGRARPGRAESANAKLPRWRQAGVDRVSMRKLPVMNARNHAMTNQVMGWLFFSFPFSKRDQRPGNAAPALTTCSGLNRTWCLGQLFHETNPTIFKGRRDSNGHFRSLKAKNKPIIRKSDLLSLARTHPRRTLIICDRLNCQRPRP